MIKTLYGKVSSEPFRNMSNLSIISNFPRPSVASEFAVFDTTSSHISNFYLLFDTLNVTKSMTSQVYNVFYSFQGPKKFDFFMGLYLL